MAWISGDHGSGKLMARTALFETSLLPPIRGMQAEGPSVSSSDCHESEEAVDVAAENRQCEKKRRLTDEQVRLLESNFAVNNKLEPERKEKLAKELGLQPRQVAVWFQNRRARSKTKQLENDFEFLKSQYESVMLERERLQAEMNRLTTELEERQKQEHEEENIVVDDNEDDEKKMVREGGTLEEEPNIKVKGKEESPGCSNSTESMEMYHNIISEGFVCLQRPQQPAYPATYASANNQSFPCILPIHGSIASSTSDISRLHHSYGYQQQQHVATITKSEGASPSQYQLPHSLGHFSIMDDNESSTWPWMH